MVYDTTRSDATARYRRRPGRSSPAPVVSAHDQTSPAVVSVVRRPWRLLDVVTLRTALSTSRLCQPDSWIDCSTDHLAELYTSELTSLLDTLTPAQTATSRRRPSDPWFDSSVLRQSAPFDGWNGCLVFAARQRPPLPGTPSDVSTVRFYDENVSSSVGEDRRREVVATSTVALHRRATGSWAPAPLTTSAQNSFIATSMTRSLVSELQCNRICPTAVVHVDHISAHLSPPVPAGDC